MSCVFCQPLPYVMENDLAYAIFDIHPISKGHCLIIPKRHIEQIFDATMPESMAMKSLVIAMKEKLQIDYQPDGYNIWVNSGASAGQIVMHAHIHLIPRYQGVKLQIKDYI